MLKNLSRLRRLLGSWTLTGDLNSEPMWFLKDSSNVIGNSQLPSFVRAALEDIRANGLAVIRGNIPHDACDALVHDFEDYCEKHFESANYRDEYSLHERLANLHLVSDSARRE